MSKSFSVNSKFKNPDKLIAKLKRELKLKSDECDNWIKQFEKEVIENKELKENAFGKLWFCYKENVTHSVAFINDPLEKSSQGKVGDEVIILGKVIEITQSAEANSASAVFETHAVFLKKNEEG
jgi:hypothetical protein